MDDPFRKGQFCGLSEKTLTISASVEILDKGSIVKSSSVGTLEFGDGSKLREIQENAFCGCPCIESLSIPQSVQYLGRHLFDNAPYPNGSHLKTLAFEPGSQLVRIDEHAFSGCRNLESIRLPASLRRIAGSAFSESGVSKLEIESGNPYFSIHDSHLIQHKSSVSILRYFGRDSDVLIDCPAEIIGPLSFDGNRWVRWVTFAAGTRVRVIRTEAFARCSYLESICIPSSVEYLHRNCFENCSRLSAVSFARGSGLRKLSQSAFEWCETLGEITIPSSVEVLGHGCFRSCRVLQSVSFESESKLRTIKGFAFSFCGQLRSFSVPSSVEFLGDFCFEGCQSLTTFAVLAPSHLLTVRSFPPNLRGSISVPDSIETFHWASHTFAFPHVYGFVILNFGLESRLRAITVTATLPGFVWRRCPCVFEQLSSPALKRLRASLEFSVADGYAPWYCENDSEGETDDESDVLPDD
jgi:hypothetical protein